MAKTKQEKLEAADTERAARNYDPGQPGHAGKPISALAGRMTGPERGKPVEVDACTLRVAPRGQEEVTDLAETADEAPAVDTHSLPTAPKAEESGARPVQAPGKQRRGFAAMDRDFVRSIASKGGKAAHEQGTAHQFTSEEARIAGRKGGKAPHVRRGRSGPLAEKPAPSVT